MRKRIARQWHRAETLLLEESLYQMPDVLEIRGGAPTISELAAVIVTPTDAILPHAV